MAESGGIEDREAGQLRVHHGHLLMLRRHRSSTLRRRPVAKSRGVPGESYNSLIQVRKSIVIISAAPIIPAPGRASGNGGSGADLIAGVIGLALLR